MIERIYEYENLYNAYLLARRQKRYRTEVLEFSYKLEENLISIQNDLIWGTYKTGPFRTFEVFEPKRRKIFALPFRDRVVQHAICSIIEPEFEKSFIHDTFACRKNKGTAAAARRLSFFLGKPTNTYYLKCDISKYFVSVDIAVLKRIIARKITEAEMLKLVFYILDNSESGLPIGNLMSQLFANVYLGELDHFIKIRRSEKYYLRYMDDFILLSNSKRKLQELWVDIEAFLYEELHLHLNPKTKIDTVKKGIDFVGFRVSSHNKIIKKDSMTRMKGRYRGWVSGKISDDRYLASIGSWVGHSRGTASHAFVEKLLLESLRTALK